MCFYILAILILACIYLNLFLPRTCHELLSAFVSKRMEIIAYFGEKNCEELLKVLHSKDLLIRISWNVRRCKAI